MKTSIRLEGIGEYYFSQKLREIDELNKAGKNIISLGIGSPDQVPHPDVIKTLQEESGKPGVHGYQSYRGSPVLREAISDWYREWYDVELDPATEILPLIGSKEGLVHIAMTYFNGHHAVFIPNPGYPTYRSAVTLAGAIPYEYEVPVENNGKIDIEKLFRQCNEMRDFPAAIIVNYPHMPTGSKGDMGIFRELVSFAK